MINLEISLGIIFWGIWSKMDYIHQVSFVPNLKGLGDEDSVPNEAHLTARHLAFLNVNQLYFELERFKAERGWYNLNLTH